MLKKCFFLVIPLFLIHCTQSYEPPYTDGLNIYVVRHAQTIANMTGDFTDSVKNNTFSDTGFLQLDSLDQRLAPYSFDAIIVSPIQRAKNTVMPYLQKNNLTAEIWPEFAEIRSKASKKDSTDTLVQGDKIHLTNMEKKYLKFRDNDSKHLYKLKSYKDGIRQVTKGYKDLLKRFDDNDKKSILVVCHSHSGSRLLELLYGIEPKGRCPLINAKINYVRQNEDGSFSIDLFNGKELSKAFEDITPKDVYPNSRF